MAINAYFKTATKRKNSTAIVQGGTLAQILLKDGTNALSPVIEVADNLTEYNYMNMIIAGKNRAYWIDDWTFEHGRYLATCTEDVLATNRSAILDSNAFITYGSVRNNDIIDRRINALPSYRSDTQEIDIMGVSGNYTYFLRAYGSNAPSGASGVAPLYALSSADIEALSDALADEGLLEQLKKFMDNPMDGLIDSYALPIIEGSFYTSTPAALALGGANIDCGARVVTSNPGDYSAKTVRVDLPWFYDDFRNNAPYTSAVLSTPWTNDIVLNIADLYGHDFFLIYYAIDVYSGEIKIECRVDNRIIGSATGNIKISVPISGANSNISGAIAGLGTVTTGALAIGAGLASGGTLTPVVGGIGAVTSGIISTEMSLATTQTRTSGSASGSACGLAIDGGFFRFSLVTCNTQTTPEDLAPIAGYPVFKVMRIGDNTGYVQTDGASVQVNGFTDEITRINSALDGGVYIE